MSKINVLLLFTILRALASAAPLAPSPSDCSSRATVDEAVDCLTSFIKLKKTGTYQDWLQWRPTDAQREAMDHVVGDLLKQKDFCENITIPDEIKDIIFVKRLETEERWYCLLSESQTVPTQYGNKFAKGWGFFLTPEKEETIERPHLHFSAAHPFYDGDVHKQAPHVFAAVGAKSVTVAGAHRHTVWDTEHLAPCDGQYHVMDPSHSTEVMFHTILMAVHRWQFGAGVQSNNCEFSNDRNSCLFVQFHGMGNSTEACYQDTMLMSVGAYGYTGKSVYDNPDSAINQLSRELVSQAANHDLDWKPHNPRKTKCPLAGSKNPFGRVLNGIDATNACAVDANASPSAITGQFIHIEQKRATRDSGNPVIFQIWDDVFLAVMP